MPFRRGRKPPETLENEQCMHCNLIYGGRHKGTNPGRQVNYVDEHGVYADDAEAAAGGLDTSDGDKAAPPQRRQAFTEAHTFSHGYCPQCYERERAAYLAEREERLKRQAAETEPADGSDGSDGEV